MQLDSDINSVKQMESFEGFIQSSYKPMITMSSDSRSHWIHIEIKSIAKSLNSWNCPGIVIPDEFNNPFCKSCCCLIRAFYQNKTF